MPAHGRAGWAGVALAVLLVGAPPVTGESAAKTKRCRSSQVRQTVTYRKASRKRRAKGCAPRFRATPAAFAAALPKELGALRAFALKLTPRKVKKLRRARA